MKKKKEIIKAQEVPNQVQHSHLADWETGVQRGEVTFSKLAQHLHGRSRKESFPASQARILSPFLGVWYSLLLHNNAHLYGCPWTAAKPTSYTSQTQTWHHRPHLSSLCLSNTKSNIKSFKMWLKSPSWLLFKLSFIPNSSFLTQLPYPDPTEYFSTSLRVLTREY